MKHPSGSQADTLKTYQLHLPPTARPLLLLLLLLPLLVFSVATRTALAASKPPLGTAGSFAVLGAQTVTNTGPTVLTGNLGVSPGTSCTGFPTPCTGGPGVVNGTIHAGDAVAATAEADAHTAYANAASQACTTNLTGQDLGGLTLTPGVYCFNSSAFLTAGNLTLTLNGKGVYIFQIGSTLITASNAQVLLINGAKTHDVFWQVGSSATLGTGTSFTGSILAEISITATTNATSSCGLYALTGAVTLDTNTIGACPGGPCSLSISQVTPQWGCPSQRTFIKGKAGTETFQPNTKTCTLNGQSCTIYIINSTNRVQSITYNGSVLFSLNPGKYRHITYTQAGTYLYGLSSDPNASLTVTIS